MSRLCVWLTLVVSLLLNENFVTVSDKAIIANFTRGLGHCVFNH